MRRTLARAGAVLAAAALLVPVAPVAAHARDRSVADSVRITVEDISPSTPAPTKKPSPLTVTLTLTNVSNSNFGKVSVLGERGYPISGQDVLEKDLANPPLPGSTDLPIRAHPAVSIPLDSGETTSVTFETATSTDSTQDGICMCHPGEIYPLFFSAHTNRNGIDTLLGVTATYLPAFDINDFPLHTRDRVSWVWPLLEPPHRLTEDTVFTDDDLAQSVAPDGRLDRALEVVQQVAEQSDPPIPLTLLIDPELLDELEVMANPTTPYTVMTSGGKTVPGTGQADASAWLSRLGNILQTAPDVQVELTPYADPDVQSLARRGLTWSNTMPAGMAARVSDALGGRSLATNLAWPVTGALTRPTLQTLVSQGVNTVVLNSTAVRTRVAEGAVQPGLARLSAGPSTDVAAALTSPTIEKYVAAAVSRDGRGVAALPDLLAELAAPITQNIAQHREIDQAITIAAPRYVDPDVAAAVRTIQETSSSTFARPVALADAVSDGLLPTGRSHLTGVPPELVAHTPATLAAAENATDALPVIHSLLDRSDPAAATFEETLPAAIQRSESSAWRAPSVAHHARRFANELNKTVDEIRSGVTITNPPQASYTFGSSTSPLPITVDNKLPYPVKIRISVVTRPPNLQGFHTKDIGTQTVEATQNRTFKVPTTLEHVGRVSVLAELYVRTRQQGDVPVGPSVEMSVRSTALGLIGVIITIVAGAVLGIALLMRLLRRLRQRRASPGGPPPVPADVVEPEPVG